MGKVSSCFSGSNPVGGASSDSGQMSEPWGPGQSKEQWLQPRQTVHSHLPLLAAAYLHTLDGVSHPV